MEDGNFFESHHNFYDAKGKNVAHCEMMGAWIILKTRNLVSLPEDLLTNFNTVDKQEGFKILTKEDTRKFAKAPNDLEIS